MHYLVYIRYLWVFHEVYLFFTLRLVAFPQRLNVADPIWRMVCAWCLHGFCMVFGVVCAWFLHGLCMVFAWFLHDFCMVFAWFLHGLCMVFAWSMHDICMVCAWYLHGFCMVCAWYNYKALSTSHRFQNEIYVCLSLWSFGPLENYA